MSKVTKKNKIRPSHLNILSNLKRTLEEKDEKIKALEEELEEKNKKILALELFLVDDSLKTKESGLEVIKQNLIDRYDIDMTYIDNLKVIAHYRYSNNPRDEYSSYHSGELELSYDYVKDNNNIISVKYTAEYNSSQSYENRYDPYVEFDSKLKVSPSNIKFDYDPDVEIYYTNPNYDDEQDDCAKWCDLINKVLKEIEGDANNFSEIVSSITNNGKINI